MNLRYGTSDAAVQLCLGLELDEAESRLRCYLKSPGHSV